MDNKFNKLVSSVLKFVKKYRGYFVIGVVAVLVCLVAADIGYAYYNKPQKSTYAEFKDDLDNGRIDTIYYSDYEENMRYTLFNDKTRGMSEEDLSSYTYSKSDWRMTKYPAGEDFRKNMLETGVNLVQKSFTPVSVVILRLLISIFLPAIIIVGLFMLVMGNQIKSNKASLVEKSDVKFSDVIGHDEVIKDLKFIVKLMQNPELGERFNANIPKGILFTGAPGTGKTLLAQAIAGEAGVPFLRINASDFIELYVGVGAKRVKSLFSQARKVAPCIVFIDELDAVAKKRFEGNQTSEDNQTINALLAEMDGFKKNKGVFIIGATNNADVLDKAVLRAGRFDRQVIIAPPKDYKVRSELFKHYLKDIPLDESLDINAISKQTIGFTGSDINTIVNEAKLIALQNDLSVLTTQCIEEAIDNKIFKGNRTKRDKYNKDNKIVAYHEAGHAVVSYLVGSPIARASIIGTTSGAGGWVLQSEKESQFSSKKELENQIKIYFGGRCSEEIKFKDVTTGASNDIKQATSALKSYILSYGFSKEFGMLDMDELVKNSLSINDDVLSLLRRMSLDTEKETLELLRKNYDYVEVLANSLLKLETMNGDDIKNLLDSVSRKES